MVFQFLGTIDEICGFNWEELTSQEMTSVAWSYYYFSVQFRENLEIALSLYPQDQKLKQLKGGECDTDNLSPWPGVAKSGERLNHDEYMRRTLGLVHIVDEQRARLVKIGEAYLSCIRKLDDESRALSIGSYENGGLERVFTAMLKFGNWNSNLLLSFKHFLVEHIRFDTDSLAGHGTLSRHLVPDDRVTPLWHAFKGSLVASVPRLIA